MSEKRTEINTAMKQALKDKDNLRLSTIRLINAAIKDRDIAARSNGNAEGISDDEILALLQFMIKQRNESIKMYQDANRAELAAQEQNEIEVIQTFLPAQLSDEETSKAVEEAITETGAESIKDMGKVMGVLKSKYAGQLDMAKVGPAVKAKLG
ncbi:MAG: glutamyl-tRNA amidotransferase [Micavibrio sp.]|nr:glutamyl-tRNA amidotransferase [Micavibrio sp.]|tara:strand:+ start:32350 stop:32811 length:462 start_codon:yes stop_codon:yes gene_type:complete